MGAAESTPTPPDNEILERRNRNIKRMDQAVRKKLRGGVSFNMKVVIRGKSGTGKTSLWRRLQGLSLMPTAVPTPEVRRLILGVLFSHMLDSIKIDRTTYIYIITVLFLYIFIDSICKYKLGIQEYGRSCESRNMGRSR